MENAIVNFEKIRRALGHKATTTDHFDVTEDGLLAYARTLRQAYQTQVDKDTADNGGNPMPIKPVTPVVDMVDLTVSHTTCTGNTRIEINSAGDLECTYLKTHFKSFLQTGDAYGDADIDRIVRRAIIDFYVAADPETKESCAVQALFGLEAHPDEWLPDQWDEAYEDVYEVVRQGRYGDDISNIIVEAGEVRSRRLGR